MDEEVKQDEQTFDLSKLVKAKNIVNIYQEGSFLVCTSDLGQRFKQGIPAGKILNKNEKGDWILEDMNLRG